VIGYEVGSDWTKASKNFSHASDALAVVVVLLLVGLIVHKAIEIRKERRADEAAGGVGTGGLPGEAAPGGTANSSEATASASPVSPSRPHSHRRTGGGS
jgi:flagellar biosynthesis/type III secretory pathway M-ring protein FliF/YscJ